MSVRARRFFDNVACDFFLLYKPSIVHHAHVNEISGLCMLITVVIPTYNRHSLLAQCLESLFRQSYSSAEFELIVVVDGGTDGTRDYLRRLKFPCAKQVIEQENRGQAAARNAGIRAARGKYILLLDDDFICDPQLLEEHARNHDGSECVVVGPIFHHGTNESIPALAVDREIRPYYRRLEAGIEEPWLPPNSSVERELLLRADGYDEQFSRAREDTDFGLRLAGQGVRFRHAPNAIVRQQYSKSADELVASSSLFGKHDVMLVRKHPRHLAQSNLSQLDRGAWWKRLMRRLVATLPFSVEPLLYPPYVLTELLRRNGTMRESSIRLLNLRRYILWVRAAVGEAGGWRALLDLTERTKQSLEIVSE
jgi:glycosyltransferase involved in cell wall biosynthesis